MLTSGIPQSSLHVLRKMCDKAWEWARTHKRIRCNPVHGEEEINVILTETYELEDVNLEETNRSGSFQVEE